MGSWVNLCGRIGRCGFLRLRKAGAMMVLKPCVGVDDLILMKPI